MHEVEKFAEIGIHIDQPVKTYSSGMMMRLAFSVQVLMDPEILIVDEALSVGDIFFQQKCFERMRYLTEKGTSILFVSHDLVTVSQFTQTAMVLHGGECVFQGESGVAVKEFQIMERASSYRPSTAVSNSVRSLHSESDASTAIQPEAIPAGVSLPSRFVESSPLAEIELAGIIQIGMENAEFVKLSLFDSSGLPATLFPQGSRMYVECEVLVHSPFECLSVGVSIKDRTNIFVHGKHSIQHGVRPAPLSAGDVVGFQFCFDLELALGQYSLDIGIIDINYSVDSGIPVELMEASITRVCLNDGFASFQIGPRPDYRYFQLPFYGVADLSGDCVRIA
jgi:lipopolysaccharide transport system ATP-binding protein